MTTSTAERVEIITTTYSKVVEVNGRPEQVVIKLTWFTNEEIDFSACNLEALGTEEEQDAVIMQLVSAKSDNVPGWKLKLS